MEAKPMPPAVRPVKKERIIKKDGSYFKNYKTDGPIINGSGLLYSTSSNRSIKAPEAVE